MLSDCQRCRAGWGWSRHVLGGEADTRALFDLSVELSVAFLFVLLTGDEPPTSRIISITYPRQSIGSWKQALVLTIEDLSVNN